METIAAVSNGPDIPAGNPIVRHHYSIKGGRHNGPIRLWKAIKEQSCLARFSEQGYTYDRIMNGDGNIVTNGVVWAHVRFQKDGKDVVVLVRATIDPNEDHMMNLVAYLV